MEATPSLASILLVGSHDQALRRLCRQLRDAGYDTAGCADTAEAATFIDSHPVDAIVLDPPAGKRAGKRLAERLRRAHPLSYVILAHKPQDVLRAVNHVFTANEN